MPTEAGLGGWLIVTVTVAVESGAQGGFDIVHTRFTGPVPPVWVNVALGSWSLLKVPVPPLRTDHVPRPAVGVLPPKLAVVPRAQMVWAGPTVATEGGWLIVIVTSADESVVHGGFEIVHRNTIGPVPPVWVKVALGS
jgi:hypothetical protein